MALLANERRRRDAKDPKIQYVERRVVIARTRSWVIVQRITRTKKDVAVRALASEGEVRAQSGSILNPHTQRKRQLLLAAVTKSHQMNAFVA